jgi:AcrR family transcriptional regulator
VANLAPALSEGELRLLLELCRRALAPDVEDYSFRASIRDLAASARCSKSHIQEHLRDLDRRGIVTYRAGTATAATAIRVNLLAGVVQTTKGCTRQGDTLKLGCTREGDTSTSTTSAEKPENMALFADASPEPRARVELDFDSTEFDVIDRMLRATPERTDPEDMRSVREWVHGYHCKFGRDPNPHAPDAHILAQLLAIGTPGQLRSLIAELMQERKEAGHSYAWYVTVALQRIHGISYQQARQAREAWKVHRGRNAAAPLSRGGAAGAPPPSEGGVATTPPAPLDTAALIRDLAQRKAL